MLTVLKGPTLRRARISPGTVSWTIFIFIGRALVDKELPSFIFSMSHMHQTFSTRHMCIIIWFNCSCHKNRVLDINIIIAKRVCVMIYIRIEMAMCVIALMVVEGCFMTGGQTQEEQRCSWTPLTLLPLQSADHRSLLP